MTFVSLWLVGRQAKFVWLAGFIHLLRVLSARRRAGRDWMELSCRMFLQGDVLDAFDAEAA